jgi:hypothetical protein
MTRAKNTAEGSGCDSVYRGCSNKWCSRGRLAESIATSRKGASVIATNELTELKFWHAAARKQRTQASYQSVGFKAAKQFGEPRSARRESSHGGLNRKYRLQTK